MIVASSAVASMQQRCALMPTRYVNWPRTATIMTLVIVVHVRSAILRIPKEGLQAKGQRAHGFSLFGLGKLALESECELSTGLT